MSIISGSVITGGAGANAATSTSITAYAVPAGANKRLIVAVHLWTTSTAIPTISSVTHNGVAMTQIAVSSSNNANGGSNGAVVLAIYELIIGSSTPTGDVVATHSASRPMIVAMTLQDAAQTGTPIVVSSQSLGPDTVASTAASDVIDFVCNYSQSVASNFAVTVGSGQTSLTNRRLFTGTGVESNLAASSANSPGASTTTMQWTGTVSAGPRAQHIVLAWAPAASVVTGAATVGGGGAIAAPALRITADSAAIAGGGIATVPGLRFTLSTAALSGGAGIVAPALRLSSGSASIAGGGTITVPAPSQATDFPVNARRILATDAAARILTDQQNTPAARIIAIGPATRTVKA